VRLSEQSVFHKRDRFTCTKQLFSGRPDDALDRSVFIRLVRRLQRAQHSLRRRQPLDDDRSAQGELPVGRRREEHDWRQARALHESGQGAGMFFLFFSFFHFILFSSFFLFMMHTHALTLTLKTTRSTIVREVMAAMFHMLS
jgi:hypothetical protein